MAKGRKTTTKTGYQNDLYLTIISSVERKGKLPDIGMKPSHLQYYVNKLKLDGVIRKIGYGTWAADRDRFEQLKYIEQLQKQGSDTKDIRGHGFHYKVALPDIKNWDNRVWYLERKNILYKESRATWKGYRILVKGYKVWLCDHVLVVYAPKGKSFFHYTARDSRIQAINDLYSVLSKVESKLNIDIKFNNDYRWKVSKQHYAKVRDSMAKCVNRETSKFTVKYNNEEWLQFDRSFNRHEQECVHPSNSEFDMDKIITPFYNDLKEHKLATGEAFTFSKIMEAIQSMQQIQQVQQQQINQMLYKPPERLDKRDSYFG